MSAVAVDRPTPRRPSLAASSRLDAVLAARWIDAMLAYWTEGIRLGAVDVGAGLDVLDLQPGAAQALRLLAPRLWRKARKRWPRLSRIRWWAVAEDASEIAGWHAQPEVRLLIQGGGFIPLLWRLDKPSPPRGLPANVPWPPVNPVVVLAQDSFRRAPQRLMGVHYGELLEGDLAAFAAQPPGNMDAWRPTRPGADLLKAGRLARRYGALLNSAPICVPEGALQCVDSLRACLPAGYLLLAAARGTASRHRLQTLGYEGVRASLREDGMLPVNFELIAQHVEGHAGASWSSESVDGQVLFAAAVDARHARRLLNASVGAMNDGGAMDGPALQEAMRALAVTGRAPVILALLAGACHDPAVFQACCPALHARWLAEPDVDRTRWSDAIQRTWRMCLPSASGRGLLRDLALAAMAIADWELAKRIWYRCLAVHGDDASDCLHLSRCEEHTGALEESVRLVERARRSAGAADVSVARLVAERLPALQARMAMPWRTVDADADIVLEPLGSTHAAALSRQYRDGQIAVMTGLPPIEGEMDAQRWIQERTADGARREMAAMHREHGFIGHVGLHVSQDVGFFYFWVGIDFQGRGYASVLGHRLCDLARRNGLRMIITSAYADNLRSLMSLSRIGFRQAATGLKSKDGDSRVFLWLPLQDAPIADPAGEIIAFHRREKLMSQYGDAAEGTH